MAVLCSESNDEEEQSNAGAQVTGCSIRACPYKVTARGYCATHYKRDLRSRKENLREGMCVVCGAPTGSYRLNVKRCAEHDSFAVFHAYLRRVEAAKVETRLRWRVRRKEHSRRRIRALLLNDQFDCPSLAVAGELFEEDGTSVELAELIIDQAKDAVYGDKVRHGLGLPGWLTDDWD